MRNSEPRKVLVRGARASGAADGGARRGSEPGRRRGGVGECQEGLSEVKESLGHGVVYSWSALVIWASHVKTTKLSPLLHQWDCVLGSGPGGGHRWMFRPANMYRSIVMFATFERFERVA